MVRQSASLSGMAGEPSGGLRGVASRVALVGDPGENSLGDLVAHSRDVGLLAATLEPVGEAVLDHVVDDRLDRGGAELALGLAPELRLGERHLQRGDQTLLHVALLGAVLAVLAKRASFLARPAARRWRPW